MAHPPGARGRRPHLGKARTPDRDPGRSTGGARHSRPSSGFSIPIALKFTAQPDIRYRIEQSDNGIDWNALSVIPAGPTMRVESLSDRDGGASEFYRLVAERMP